MKHIENSDIDDSLKEIDEILKKLQKNGTQIKLTKSKSDFTSIFMLGQTGSGKSTTGNVLLKEYQDEKNKNNNQNKDNQNQNQKTENKFFFKNDGFKMGKGIESVTKEVEAKQVSENFQIVDSIGYGDTEGYLNDYMINIKISDYLNKNMLQQKGVSSVLQCVMMGNGSCRLDAQKIQSMVFFLLSLNIDLTGEIGELPRFCVLFTNVSESEENEGDDDGWGEDFEEEKEEENGKKVEFKELIKGYKKQLKKFIFDLYGKNKLEEVEKLKIHENLEKIFVNGNFYAFRYRGKNKEKELQVIQRIIEDSFKTGSYVNIDQQQSLVTPIIINQKQVEQYNQQILKELDLTKYQINEMLRNFSENKYQITYRRFLKQIGNFHDQYKKFCEKSPLKFMKMESSQFIYIIEKLQNIRNEFIKEIDFEKQNQYFNKLQDGSEQNYQKLKNEIKEGIKQDKKGKIDTFNSIVNSTTLTVVLIQKVTDLGFSFDKSWYEREKRIKDDKEKEDKKKTDQQKTEN
ncbi:P-loop containing nucleoside triphosphate hydrolase [Pseudocohnilembus persalinus]|uniref:p-loop containing nucleoside triphosphate hydrolase n=1 Tax=Pseudocohnilembus persalinus TaxID=266149 RepID=A0A0V0QEB0_PSEPJ|nr:P-loop containing nucleoside triphosphate hydrolase [Pseudocohnilembus persalinus]|eukprot:KRX00561.1 P-loop containing nucleoside triphosphate hydrolase [Pseudocohnilembus persalinus]